MTGDPILTVRTLPSRPTKLSDDALSDVFGGCRGEGERCGNAPKNCCGDLECDDDGPFTPYTCG
jgi:hypothetical protein